MHVLCRHTVKSHTYMHLNIPITNAVEVHCYVGRNYIKSGKFCNG